MVELKPKLARSLFKRLGLLESTFKMWRSLPFLIDKQARKPSVLKSVSMRGFHMCGVFGFFFLALLFFMFTLFYLDVVRLMSAPTYSSGILLHVAAIRSIARLNAGFIYDDHSLALSTSQGSSYSLPPNSIEPINQTSTFQDAEYLQNQSIVNEGSPSQISYDGANATDLQEVNYNHQNLSLTNQLPSNDTDFQEGFNQQNLSMTNQLNTNAGNVTDFQGASDQQKLAIEEVVNSERDSIHKGDKQCNLFEGRWVQDQSYPLYNSEACAFIDSGFRCQENGRPDQDYLRWRWQPLGCDLSRGCYFQVDKHANTSMELSEGFSRAMRTWRDWVAREVDLTKTQVFFRSYAPVHFSNGTWKTGGQCHKDTKPWPEETKFEEEYWTNTYIVGEVARLQEQGQVGKFERESVQVLDITGLSNYRKDAHSSIYHVSKEEARPMHRQDCSHWCLPGLPDVWNELLFASLSPSHFSS